VALELAQDRRDGERGEVDAVTRVVAVDRLDQADERDLHEVVGRFSAPQVAARQVLRERKPSLDHPATELVARRIVRVHGRERIDQFARGGGVEGKAATAYGNC
jgi:hypothetical protein